ncbi:unnamed protein product [Prorocentrum cordatum]|uniref:Uncharacterized protein n=1 Tax=Prorocentrum cordatum TaxID=2364126 RepID=A0ABN9TI17_9DINO|nr:unnamed protein product [Polarella glacialis]
MVPTTLSGIGSLIYDCVERVEVPRKIVIRNIRVGMFLRLLQVGTFGGLTMVILVSSSWNRTIEPSNFKLLGQWDDTLESDYNAADRADWTSTVCTNTESYDYVYSDSWRYGGYSCHTPTKSERLMRVGDKDMYFPTSYEETHTSQIPIPSSGNCTDTDIGKFCIDGWKKKVTTCECSDSRYYLVTGVDALRVGFIHGYTVGAAHEQLANYQGSAQQSDQTCGSSGSNRCEADSSSGSETREMRTVLVLKRPDGEEELLGYKDAPDDVAVSLHDVLIASGLSLDSHVQTKENLLSCLTREDIREEPCRPDVHKLPRVRQVGMEMDIHLDYSNQYHYPKLPCENCLEGHVGPVCKATIEVTPSWQSRPQTDCRQGDVEGSTDCWSRYAYGIHITWRSTGKFGYTDPVYVMVTLAAALVYLAIPLVVIEYLTLYFLGMQSTMYRKASRDVVTLQSQLSDLLYRMVSSHAVFRAVKCPTDENIPGESLKHFIKQHALVGQKDNDVQVGEKEHRLLVELLLDAATAGDEGCADCVTLHEFLRAEGGEFNLDVQDVLKLCDAERQKQPLEQLFTPTRWAEAAREARQRRSSRFQPIQGQRDSGAQKRASGGSGGTDGGAVGRDSVAAALGGPAAAGGYGKQQLDVDDPPRYGRPPLPQGAPAQVGGRGSSAPRPSATGAPGASPGLAPGVSFTIEAEAAPAQRREPGQPAVDTE